MLLISKILFFSIKKFKSILDKQCGLFFPPYHANFRQFYHHDRLTGETLDIQHISKSQASSFSGRFGHLGRSDKFFQKMKKKDILNNLKFIFQVLGREKIFL